MARAAGEGRDRPADVAGKARESAQEVQRTAREVADSRWFSRLVGVGLVAVGVVHILIGILALQLAFTGGKSKNADQKGALAAIASNPFGGALMWVCALALFAVFLWKLTQAWWGFQWKSGMKRTWKRISAAAGGVVYLVLGITAIGYALGSGSSSSNEQQESWAGKLLSEPFGQVLAVVAGLIVLAVAGFQIKRGITSHFTQDLEGEPPAWAKRLGQVGYIAKGVAIALVGVLFVWAALSFDPKKAGGLDDALKTVRDQGAIGPVMLTVIAVGLIAFGAYCFVWARRPRRS